MEGTILKIGKKFALVAVPMGDIYVEAWVRLTANKKEGAKVQLPATAKIVHSSTGFAIWTA